MRRTLVELFKEAQSDCNATDCNGKEYLGRLSLGIKIVTETDTKEVRIFNTHLGGGFYKELTPDEVEYFRVFGWSLGVFHLSLKNTQHKLDNTAITLKELGATKRHQKLVEELTLHKKELTERYNAIQCRKRNYLKHLKLQSNDNRKQPTSI